MVALRQPTSRVSLDFDSNTLWLALALLLLAEGILPFVSPSSWRRLFVRILQLTDGQIRFYAAASVAAGLLLICLLVL